MSMAETDVLGDKIMKKNMRGRRGKPKTTTTAVKSKAEAQQQDLYAGLDRTDGDKNPACLGLHEKNAAMDSNRSKQMKYGVEIC